jgi:hypothetical protein
MARGKKRRDKGDYFRQGKRSTKTLEHHVPTLFLAIAQSYGISLHKLCAQIKTYADDAGLHVEHISYKNKSGQRVRIIETKSFQPPPSDNKYHKDGLVYVDDVTRTEYKFVLENSNGHAEKEVIASDPSKKVSKQLEQLLMVYSQGGLR